MTPQATATLTVDGLATLTVDGETENFTGRNTAEARRHVFNAVVEMARDRGHALRLSVDEPEGKTLHIVVSPDGEVSEAPALAPAEETSSPAPGATVPASASPASASPAAQGPARRRRTAADFGASRIEASTSPAQEGWQGTLNKLTGGALRLGPGPAESARRAWRASVQRGLAGAKSAAFLNIKGGATKTTVTYLVAATLGRVRGGNILAWDNNENKGTLGDRALKSAHDHTAIDLLENIDRFATPTNAHEIINYVRPQGENKFHVLASQNQAADKEVIDGNAFVQLHGALRQFYHLALVDTGNASTAGTWQAAVDIADELVLVAMNKEDSAKTLAATVDTLTAMGYGSKLARGVVIVTQPPIPSKNRAETLRKNNARLEEMKAHFGEYVREVIVVPFDDSLDQGGDIVYENLAPATQEAYLQATAAIVEGL